MKIKFTSQNNQITCETSMHICHDKSSVPYQLFQYLHTQAYQTAYKASWVPRSPTTQVLETPSVNLPHMARTLRAQDWKIYYWRDWVDEEQDYLFHSAPQGLIVGRYCVNLLAWQLSYT